MTDEIIKHGPIAGFSIPSPTVPSDEESRPHMKKAWDRQAPAAIDQWPQAIADLSVKTTLIEIDFDDVEAIYDRHGDPGLWREVMDRYAEKIDAITGWTEHFIRLSTRSPKDVAYPGLPITMSGKQAMMWISCSERCLDDIYMAKCAREPIFIAVRETYHAADGGEFRCFVKDGKLIAVSRYDFNKPAQLDYSGLGIFEKLSAFSDEHIAPHYDNIVFDVEMGCDERGGLEGAPLLIEVNPYGLSHPCLFGDYEQIEHDGGFRWKTDPDMIRE